MLRYALVADRFAGGGRSLADKWSASKRDNSLSIQGTTTGFATAGRQRKAVSGQGLPASDFSPAYRQPQRVKTPRVEAFEDPAAKSVEASILPLAESSPRQFATRSFPK